MEKYELETLENFLEDVWDDGISIIAAIDGNKVFCEYVDFESEAIRKLNKFVNERNAENGFFYNVETDKVEIILNDDAIDFNKTYEIYL